MSYKLRILGPPDFHNPDGTPVSLSLGKPLALLIYIACHSEGVSRDELANLLWPGATREKGRHSVRQAVWVLKNAAGEDLFTGEESLSLREGLLETDLQAFRGCLTQGDIDGARALWRGPFLEKLVLSGGRHWDHWVEDVRADLERRFHKAVLLTARELQQEGRAEEALEHLEFAIGVTPTNVGAHEARVEVLLELLRLGEAREALADAYRAIGDQPGARESMGRLEARLSMTVRDQRARVQETEGFPLEFVGRSRELALLRALWQDARSGRSRVTVITGPAGIGKTRMGKEFLASIVTEDARQVETAGSRAEMKLRWGAAADLARQLLLRPGSAGISSASDSLLRSMIPSLGRGEVNLQTVNGVSPAALLDAFTDLLEAVSFEMPLAVVLDDFQWFDRDSRTLLIGAMRRVRNLHVLFIVQGRSDLTSRNWDDLERTLREDVGATRLLLNPLSASELQELLGLVAEFPDPEDAHRVVHRIHQVTGGNPLFVRSVLKELSDQEILRKDGEVWVFHTQELPLEFPFPDSVIALLTERLQRLSDDAISLAGALAAAGRGKSPTALRKVAELDESAFARSVAELIEREIVCWVDTTTLDFCHDLMRQAALAHFPSPKGDGKPRFAWFRRFRGLLAAVLVGAVTLPLGMFWGSGIGSEDPETPPFGGGTLVFQIRNQGVSRIEVGPGTPQDWSREEIQNPPRIPGMKAFRGEDGNELWFGVVNDPDGPDVVRILEDGNTLPVVGGPGDQILHDLSPDGTRLLFSKENLGREPFSRSVYISSLLGGPEHLFYENYAALQMALWSKDGDMVAVGTRAEKDTLSVISVTGERLGSMVMTELLSGSWCGSDLIISSRSQTGTDLLRVRVPLMEVDTIAAIDLGRGLRCSPDGTAIIHGGVLEDRLAVLLRNLETGEVQPILTGDLTQFKVDWLPDRVSPVPLGVELPTDTVRVLWGERIPLSASLLFSDGTRTSEGIRWESSDQDVASVDRNQRLTGNGAGITRVLASYGYSFRDTVIVEVLDGGSGGAFKRERFENLDTSVWIPIGDPLPEAKTIEGESVLSILGDEKYTDGILFRNPIPLGQGATIELEFKLDLTRDQHQNFSICLMDVGPDLAERTDETLRESTQEACFRYPAGEVQRMDPTEAVLWVIGGIENRVVLPHAFPPRDWTHVALQVRADGEVSLVVDREVVATNPIHVRPEPDNQWTLMVYGDAVETELLVRNLTIWRETRYSGIGTGSPGSGG